MTLLFFVTQGYAISCDCDVCEHRTFDSIMFSHEHKAVIVLAFFYKKGCYSACLHRGMVHSFRGLVVISHIVISGSDSKGVESICFFIGFKYHRLGGPAIIYQSGEEWYMNGNHHRVGGPADRYRTPDGSHTITYEWWIHGVCTEIAIVKDKTN